MKSEKLSRAPAGAQPARAFFSFPGDDPLSLGMLGMHGGLCTNMVLEDADPLIDLGVRFDEIAAGQRR